ncbi:unnamed protein product [Amoebophrya sp. A25]|nr:unnamed protein product [Amoebophrya sp. A25]|eukprot:GSA25T00022709001.1
MADPQEGFDKMALRQIEQDLTKTMGELGHWHEVDGKTSYIYAPNYVYDGLDKIYTLYTTYGLTKQREILRIICDLKFIPEAFIPLLETRHTEDPDAARRVISLLVVLTQPLLKRGFTGDAAMKNLGEWNIGDAVVREHLAHLQMIKEHCSREATMSGVYELLMASVDSGIDFKKASPQAEEEERIRNRTLSEALLLFRNLLSIPDPRPGDAGYTDNRKFLHVKFVKMYAKLDILHVINTWAYEETSVVKPYAELTERDREARWVLFDVVYSCITKLSCQEVVETDTSKDMLKAFLVKDRQQKVIAARTAAPRHGEFGVSAHTRQFLGDKTLKLERENVMKARIPLKKQYGNRRTNQNKDNLTDDVLFQDLAPATGSAAEHNRLNPFAQPGTTLAESLDAGTLAIMRAWLYELLDCKEGSAVEEEDYFPMSVLCQFVIQEVKAENDRVAEEKRMNPEGDNYDQQDRSNPYVTYHTKDRIINFITFFLEFYRLYARQMKKESPGKNFQLAPQVIQGFVDLDTTRYLVGQVKEQGKDVSINPDRLILVLRACVETMKMLGDCCRSKDPENKQLAYVLVENLVGRNIGQRLVEVCKLYKPQTHDPRVISYAIECLHFCLLLMEEVARPGEGDREFPVLRFTTQNMRDVSTIVTISTYIKGLSDWAIIQNLLTCLESYHHTNENQLYSTCKLIRRIIDSHPAYIALFWNLRFFARMDKIVKSDIVKQNPGKFSDLHRLFKQIIREFVKVWRGGDSGGRGDRADARKQAISSTASKAVKGEENPSAANAAATTTTTTTTRKPGNKLAITELILNVAPARDDLSGSIETWAGILENYETAHFQKHFRDMVENRKQYNEMFEDARNQKRQEHPWTADEDTELKRIFESCKNIHMTQDALVKRVAADMTTFSESISRRDVRLRMVALKLITAAKKLGVEDLAEKVAKFVLSAATTGANYRERAWALLEKVHRGLVAVRAARADYTFSYDFANLEASFRNNFVEVLKCLDVRRVLPPQKKKGLEQEDAGLDEDGPLESSLLQFKIPFVPTSAISMWRELHDLFRLSESGLKEHADAKVARRVKTEQGPAKKRRKLMAEEEFTLDGVLGQDLAAFCAEHSNETLSEFCRDSEDFGLDGLGGEAFEDEEAIKEVKSTRTGDKKTSQVLVAEEIDLQKNIVEGAMLPPATPGTEQAAAELDELDDDDFERRIAEMAEKMGDNDVFADAQNMELTEAERAELLDLNPEQIENLNAEIDDRDTLEGIENDDEIKAMSEHLTVLLQAEAVGESGSVLGGKAANKQDAATSSSSGITGKTTNGAVHLGGASSSSSSSAMQGQSSSSVAPKRLETYSFDNEDAFAESQALFAATSTLSSSSTGAAAGVAGTTGTGNIAGTTGALKRSCRYLHLPAAQSLVRNVDIFLHDAMDLVKQLQDGPPAPRVRKNLVTEQDALRGNKNAVDYKTMEQRGAQDVQNNTATESSERQQNHDLGQNQNHLLGIPEEEDDDFLRDILNPQQNRLSNANEDDSWMDGLGLEGTGQLLGGEEENPYANIEDELADDLDMGGEAAGVDEQVQQGDQQQTPLGNVQLSSSQGVGGAGGVKSGTKTTKLEQDGAVPTPQRASSQQPRPVVKKEARKTADGSEGNKADRGAIGDILEEDPDLGGLLDMLDDEFLKTPGATPGPA